MAKSSEKDGGQTKQGENIHPKATPKSKEESTPKVEAAQPMSPERGRATVQLKPPLMMGKELALAGPPPNAETQLSVREPQKEESRKPEERPSSKERQEESRLSAEQTQSKTMGQAEHQISTATEEGQVTRGRPHLALRINQGRRSQVDKNLPKKGISKRKRRKRIRMRDLRRDQIKKEKKYSGSEQSSDESQPDPPKKGNLRRSPLRPPPVEGSQHKIPKRTRILATPPPPRPESSTDGTQQVQAESQTEPPGAYRRT